jgi:hypothetical protein
VKVFPLPPDWPQLNAPERIWNDTRKHVTHNHFFERPRELCEALFRRFDYVRQNREEIAGLLRPFFKLNVELFMRCYIVHLRDQVVITGLCLFWIHVGTFSLYGQDQNSAGSTEPVITTDRPAITDSSIVVSQTRFAIRERARRKQQPGDSAASTFLKLLSASDSPRRRSCASPFRTTVTILNLGRGLASGWGDLSLGGEAAACGNLGKLRCFVDCHAESPHRGKRHIESWL